MTSKSLFFRLMKEDLKRKIWAIGLSFLMFFFWMPVAAAMGISSLKQNLERWLAEGTTFGEGITAQMQYETRLLDLVTDILGFGNAIVALTIGIAAIVLALTAFMYLHSRKQMDFYHSIPVRREVIFAVKYLDGFLIVVSMYLLNMIFALGIFAANGVGLSTTAVPAFMAMFVHMVGFLLIYGLMTIAVVLTGNFFISILGGIVLFSYVPAFVSLVEGLMYLFFAAVNLRAVPLSSWMVHGSPIAYYTSLVNEGYGMELAKYGIVAGKAAVAFIAVLLMTAVALVLYKLRPSESAGKAMAFKLSKAPIKILLVVPVTIFAALLFWNVYYSMLWAVFGFLLGLVLSHGIIEIIYHFEFRKLFANPAQMGICAVLSLAVIGFFRYDVIGYDRYLPKEADFQSASLYGYGMRDWNEYGLPIKDSDGYSWNYMDGSNYAAGNMEVTDYSLIQAIAEAGIENARTTREDRILNHWEYTKETEAGYWISLEMGYHLKNGKKVYRNYSVNLAAMRETFEALYTTPEYKKGVYPVLSYHTDNLMGIYEARDGRIQELATDQKVMEEILSAYKEELTALTLEERSRETPVTSIRFLTVAEYEYLTYITSHRYPNYNGDFRLDDMNQVNFFPVYPSFTKTIALLKENGSYLTEPISVEDVERVTIYGSYVEEMYGDTFARDGEVVYAQTYDQEMGRNTIIIENDGSAETAEKIQEILDSIVISDMAEMNGLQPFDRSFSILILLKDEKGDAGSSAETFRNYIFRYQEVPEFIKEAAGYDPLESDWRNINYGLNGQP